MKQPDIEITIEDMEILTGYDVLELLEKVGLLEVEYELGVVKIGVKENEYV